MFGECVHEPEDPFDMCIVQFVQLSFYEDELLNLQYPVRSLNMMVVGLSNFRMGFL
uniref:Uncharacterized protein n=1 Tax=Arion vulgaris TaxID=1028688 RepID=A0A0B6ZJR6_9EUPU